jgi:dihydrofolate synthase/folylpolyglutamate synthase
MTSSDPYQQALDYIYSFVDLSRTRQENLAPENFDLSRVDALMSLLGSPHQAYPSIHVAGSKGKGSVSAFCASVLHAAGYRVGLYTSPHMQDFTERIQVSLQKIPPKELAALVEEIKPHVAAIPRITTFEIMTAIAFLYFARQEVDIAVFEVGLGGRLDATNVVTPLVSVITSLSLEHTSILGGTLAEIAGEKAGIIKEDIPVVTAPQVSEAIDVIQQTAAQHNAPLIEIGVDYHFAAMKHSLDGQSFRIWGDDEDQAAELEIGLLGEHQVENAAVAYAALKSLGEHGFKITTAALQLGFAGARWPGRFEILSREPFVVVDSAHNLASSQKLSRALREYFPDHARILIFGCSEDKDAAGMLSELAPRAEHIIATRSLHPRAMQPELLLEIAQQFGRPTTLAPLIEDAIEAALDLVKPDGLILVTGSVFLAGAGRAAWTDRQTAMQEV